MKKYGDQRWWDESNREKAHEIIWKIAENLKSRQSDIWSTCKRNADAYGIRITPYKDSFSELANSRRSFEAANVIDSMVSMAVKNRIVPMALTEGGTAKERRRAREYNKAIDGLFDRAKVHRKLAPILFDSTLYKVGIYKVCDIEDEIDVERVMRWDLEVDEYACRNGKPRQLFQRYEIDRMVLIELGKKRSWSKEVLAALEESEYQKRPWDIDVGFDESMTSDLITVREAWHLPSGSEASDGCRMLVVSNTVCEAVDYEDDDFPFVFISEYAEHDSMFPPTCAMDRMYSIQERIQHVDAVVDECIDLMAIPRVVTFEGSNFKKVQLNDIPGGILQVSSPQLAPVAWNAQPYHPELANYRERLVESLVKASGMNEMSTYGQKPSGVTAASAMQLLDDLQTESKVLLLRRLEDAMCELAEKILQACRRIVDRTGSYEIMVEDTGRKARKLNFNEIDISQDSYLLKVFPTSWLARTPTAKLQQLTELVQSGIFTPEQFFRLSGMPDLEAESQLDRAVVELIDLNIDDILSDGIEIIVEPFHDHQKIIERGAKAYDMAKIKKEPEDRLALLRDYIAQAQSYLEKLAPPPAPMPMPGAPMPGMPPPGMGVMPTDVMPADAMGAPPPANDQMLPPEMMNMPQVA